MMLLAAALTFAGMLGLCAAMERHQGQILMAQLAPSRARLLRLTGWLLLVAGFAAAVTARGWAIGSVTWVSLCGAAAVCVVLLLTFYPRLLPRLGLLALVLGAAAGLTGLF